MADFHDQKLVQSIKDIAGTFVQRESNGVSLITVTRVELSSKGDRAAIFVSVFPETQEETALAFLTRNRGEFKDMFKERVHVGRIPFFEFHLDPGEKLRNKINALM